MSNGRELIWVSEKVAKQYKGLESGEEQEEIIRDLLKQKRIDMERENEQLEESVLVFKSVCLAHKREITKVYEEQAKLLEELWEESGDISMKVHDQVEKITEQIAPLKKEIDILKTKIRELNIYIPENFVSLAAQVRGMDNDTKMLLRDLLDMSIERTEE